MPRLLLVLVALSLPGFAAEDERPPNVLLIISDDQGHSDYGFLGHPAIETPHLDALAERSLVFARGYVASPLCRPSLATIATGLHPHQHGVSRADARLRPLVFTNVEPTMRLAGWRRPAPAFVLRRWTPE